MDADENIMTHPDTSLREGVSFSLLFDLRGSCGSLVSEFHELWPWIESKSGHQLFCVMEYIYRIYINIYVNMLMYVMMVQISNSTISFYLDLPMITILCSFFFPLVFPKTARPTSPTPNTTTFSSWSQAELPGT